MVENYLSILFGLSIMLFSVLTLVYRMQYVSFIKEKVYGYGSIAFWLKLTILTSPILFLIGLLILLMGLDGLFLC